MKLVPLLVCATITSLLASQPPALISPIGAVWNTSGTSSMPFSFTGAYQQVHSAASFSSQAPAVLTQMRFRHPYGYANNAGPTLDVELFVARSPNDAGSASEVFASNVIPRSEVNVFVRKVVSLPTVPNTDWMITFAFDVPYVWTPGDTSWRTVVWSSVGGSQLYLFDFWYEEGGATRFGKGCAPAAATLPQDALLMGGPGQSSPSGIGGPGTAVKLMGSSSYYPSTQPAVLTLGRSNTNWGGIPLPHDLTQWGAPGCSIYNDASVLLTGFSSPGNNLLLLFGIPIPYGQHLIGQTCYAQLVIPDPAANALGLTTSNGLAFTIPRPRQATLIYARNPNATVGTGEGGRHVAIGFN